MDMQMSVEGREIWCEVSVISEVVCSSRPAGAESTEVCPRLLGKPHGDGEQLFTALCPSVCKWSRPLGKGVFGPLLL